MIRKKVTPDLIKWFLKNYSPGHSLDGSGVAEFIVPSKKGDIIVSMTYKKDVDNFQKAVLGIISESDAQNKNKLIN